MNYYDSFIEWMHDGYSVGWQWVDHLDRDGWLLLLATTTVMGFFCLRGYGSRNNY